MSRKTSSLRQRCGPAALSVGVVLALACPGAALAAGGAPLPAPDDPPTGHSPTRHDTACAGGVVVAHGTEGSVVVHGTEGHPYHADAGFAGDGGAGTNRATTGLDRVGADHTDDARAVPGRVAYAGARRRGATRGTTRETGSHPATAGNAEARKRRPRRRPRRAARHPRAPHRPTTRAGSGCPSRASSGSTDDGARNAALLVAAALLLAASGAGSLTVGLTVRRIARGT